MRKIVITGFLFLLSSLFSKAVVALAFPVNTVSIYFNGQKITDNSIIWQASYKTYFEVCPKGTCSIGQQFYPVTIYKVTVGDTPTYDEYVQKKIAAKTAYSRTEYDQNLQNLIKSASVIVTFNPSLSGAGQTISFDLASQMQQKTATEAPTLTPVSTSSPSENIVSPQDTTKKYFLISGMAILILTAGGLAVLYKRRKKLLPDNTIPPVPEKEPTNSSTPGPISPFDNSISQSRSGSELNGGQANH